MRGRNLSAVSGAGLGRGGAGCSAPGHRGASGCQAGGHSGRNAVNPRGLGTASPADLLVHGLGVPSCCSNSMGGR